MNKNSLCVFFIITFLQTGVSNSNVSISVRQEGDNLVLTCVLTGKESLTQINWMMMQGANHTQLGIFHPIYGIHIPPEHFGTVKIEGKTLPVVFSDLHVKQVVLNESAEICCQFVTFPSGSLIQCSELKDSITKAEAQIEVRKLGLFGQFGALTVGSFLSLLVLIIFGYLCKRCFCGRKQILEIQQTYHTVSSAPMETYTEEVEEEIHNPTPTSSGFDPKKLYAKIKEDLYYGRLWKAYQGRERVSAPGCLPGSRQIYYLLGENSLPRSDEEHTTEGTDTARTSESSN